jgi:hypothetical protein
MYLFSLVHIGTYIYIKSDGDPMHAQQQKKALIGGSCQTTASRERHRLWGILPFLWLRYFYEGSLSLHSIYCTVLCPLRPAPGRRS